MKKLKLLGTGILAASLILAGCSQAVDEVIPGLENPGIETQTPTDGTKTPDSSAGAEDNAAEEDKSDAGDKAGDKEEDNNDGETPAPAVGYEVSFAGGASNGNTYTYENGVYTITFANANSADWDNQVFIANPNAAAGVKKGDKIHASVTLEADKEITNVLVKNQFNAHSYSGNAVTKNVPANTPVVFDIYSAVQPDYDDSSNFVFAVRGNEAGTKLKISNIKVELIPNYSVESITITPKKDEDKSGRVACGGSIELTATDQYGIELNDVTFEIVKENAFSTIEGKNFVAGNTAEEVKVVGKISGLTSTELTITVYEASYSNIILFDKSKSINELNTDALEQWVAGYAMTLEDGIISASGTYGSCFGIYLKSPAQYKNGAKMKVTYTATKSFSIKPVNPDAEFVLEAAENETTETIDLGNQNTLTKIGIVFKPNESEVKISAIEIVNE